MMQITHIDGLKMEVTPVTFACGHRAYANPAIGEPNVRRFRKISCPGENCQIRVHGGQLDRQRGSIYR